MDTNQLQLENEKLNARLEKAKEVFKQQAADIKAKDEAFVKLKDEYNELSKPKFDDAYDEVKKFIKSCADEQISVIASVVEGYKGRHLDLDACEKIAHELGAKFRVREWIQSGY